MVSYESSLATVLDAAGITPLPLHNILLDLANTIDRVRNDIVYNAKRMAENPAAYAKNTSDGFLTANSPAVISTNEGLVESAAPLREAHYNFRMLAGAVLTQDQWDEFNRLIRGE